MIPNPDENPTIPTDLVQSLNPIVSNDNDDSIESAHGESDSSFTEPETPTEPEVVSEVHRQTNQHPHIHPEIPDVAGVISSSITAPELPQHNQVMSDEPSEDSTFEEQGSISTEDYSKPDEPSSNSPESDSKLDEPSSDSTENGSKSEDIVPTDSHEEDGGNKDDLFLERAALKTPAKILLIALFVRVFLGTSGYYSFTYLSQNNFYLLTLIYALLSLNGIGLLLNARIKSRNPKLKSPDITDGENFIETLKQLFSANKLQLIFSTAFILDSFLMFMPFSNVGFLFNPLMMINTILLLSMMPIHYLNKQSSQKENGLVESTNSATETGPKDNLFFYSIIGAMLINAILLSYSNFLLFEYSMIPYIAYPIVNLILLIIAAIILPKVIDPSYEEPKLDRTVRLNLLGEFSRKDYSGAIVLILVALFVNGALGSHLKTLPGGTDRYYDAIQPNAYSNEILLSYSLLVIFSGILFTFRRGKYHRELQRQIATPYEVDSSLDSKIKEKVLRFVHHLNYLKLSLFTPNGKRALKGTLIGLLIYLTLLLNALQSPQLYMDSYQGDSVLSPYLYTSIGEMSWIIFTIFVIIWLVMITYHWLKSQGGMKVEDEDFILKKYSEKMYSIGFLLTFTLCLSSLLKEHGYNHYRYFEGYGEIDGGLSILPSYLANEYGDIVIIAYYTLLIIATIKAARFLSWKESTATIIDVDQTLFEVRGLNEEGVRQYSEGDYFGAEKTFKQSLKLVVRAMSSAEIEDGTDVAETLNSFKEYIETNLANAASGIIGKEVQESMTAIDERVTAIQQNVDDNPVAAKRTARQIEDEIITLHTKAETHGFETVGEFCLSMLDRVREIAATADRILMGAVSQTNPIASPTLNQTPSIGAIPEDVADSHASAAASQAAMVGATDLSSRFIIGELIAVGGMANVFLATEIATARKVIWKQAHGEFNPLHVSNQKLADEVELLQIARHPRIPDYLAHGGSIDSKGEGQHCSVLIEEYIPGGDLKNTIEQITKVGAVISLPKIIEYMVAICEPLEHMANLAQPVYHRDLKPHNIIIHPERGPVLIDFGLAKMVATGEDVSITRGGSGTWTPPERDAGVSGPFTDVYSLGKILYFLLTNQPPAAILTTEKLSPITATGHPEWIADLTLRAAWPDQNDRIQTVREFRIFLENEGYWPDGIEMESSAGADDYTTWE